MLTDYAIACVVFGARGGIQGAKWLASVDNVHLDTVYQAIPYVAPVVVSNVIYLADYRAHKEGKKQS